MQKISIVFISNELNHHQIPLCDSFYSQENVHFSFYALNKIADERLKIGYAESPKEYLTYINENNMCQIQNSIDGADVVIIGSAPISLVDTRIRNNKIVFTYSERVFKNLHYVLSGIKGLTLYKRFIKPSKSSNCYLLCASSYMKNDMEILHAYRDKMFKWGYFPEHINSDYIPQNNNCIKILWVGRLLKWKNPLHAVYLAEHLKKRNINFVLQIVGIGPEENSILRMIKKKRLTNYCYLCGALPNKEVRQLMQDADIFLFSSNKSEGWGAVLNEAMDSHCCVVANTDAGATNYLVKDRVNGISYQSTVKNLISAVDNLIDDLESIHMYQLNAYKTISETWNSDVAVERFVDICSKILLGDEAKDNKYYLDGPMSRA